MNVDLKFFPEFPVYPILDGLDFADERVVLPVVVDSAHIDHSSLASFFHGQLVHRHHYFPQLLYSLLEGLGLKDLALGLREAEVVEELECCGCRLAIVDEVVLLHEGVEEQLRLFAVVDEVLHVFRVAVLSNKGFLRQLALDSLDLVLCLALEQSKPSFSDQYSEFVLMFVLQLLYLLLMAEDQRFVLASNDPKPVEDI